MSSTESTADGPREQEKSGTTTPANVKLAKEDDEHILPHNNLPLVFFGLMMTAFLVRVLRVFILESS